MNLSDFEVWMRGELQAVEAALARWVPGNAPAGLGLAMRLSDHGVDRQALPGMAVQAHAIRRLMDFNPRDLSVGDIEAIYQAAY